MPMMDFAEEDLEDTLQRTEQTPNTVAPRIRKYFPETWIWNCIETRFVKCFDSRVG